MPSLAESLKRHGYKIVKEGELEDFDEEDTPDRSLKKYANIPETQKNVSLFVPCHPEYHSFITLNEDEEIFYDLKTENINIIIREVNVVMEGVIEAKNSVEFDNHYKVEGDILFWVGLIGIVYLILLLIATMYQFGNDFDILIKSEILQA